MIERTGGCLCGAVRYRVTAEPLATRICWCRDCQHLAGNGTVNGIFPAAAIHVDGVLAEYTSDSDGGNAIRRRFCPGCGSHLFADAVARPGFAVVRLGTLDDPASLAPAINMWCASAPPWAWLDPALERAERQPAPPVRSD